MMKSSLSSSRVVFHNAFFNLLGFLCTGLYMLALVSVVVGYVGLETFGLWSLTTALTGYLGLADLGIGTSFVKYIAEFASSGDQRSVGKVVQMGMLFYMLTWSVVSTVGILAFPYAFALLNIPAGQYALAQRMIYISLFNFGVASATAVLASVLSGIQRNDVYNLIVVCSLATKFALILALLHAGYGILGMMAGDVIVTFLMILPLWIAIRKTYPEFVLGTLAYDHAVMKTLLRFGTQLQVGRFAETIQFQFDKLLLSRFIGLPAVSMYDFGSRPLSRIRALPLTAGAALIPAVSALDAADNRERILAALVRGTRYVVLLGLPMFGFLVCFADDLMRIWLGQGYGQSAMTMRVLSFAFFVNVAVSPLSYVSQGQGKPRYQMLTTLVQVIFNVALSTILVIVFGYFGAVAGTTTAVVIGSVVFFQWYGKTMLPHPMRLLASILGRPVIAVAIAGALGVAIQRAILGVLSLTSRFEIAFALALSSLLFAALYAILLRVTKSIGEDDRRFLAGVLPPRFHGVLRLLA